MLSTKRVKLLLCSIFVCAMVGDAHTTGPSYMNVVLYPVSYTAKGFVLFKSTYEANSSGAHGPMPILGKWMVVSPKGEMWEYPYKNHEPKNLDDNVDAVIAEREAYMKEMSSPVNWSHPPTSVRPLMKRYGFGKVKIAHDKFTGTLHEYLKKKRPEVKKLPAMLPIRSTRGLRSQLNAKTCKVGVFFSRGPVFLVGIIRGSMMGDKDEGHAYGITTSDRTLGRLEVFDQISMYGVVVLPEK